MGEVRKLQKKLRQIENLEIKPFLSQEEKVKILKKAELRSRLAELLLQLSALQQTQGILEDEETMKRPVEDNSAVFIEHTPPSKVLKGVTEKSPWREPGRTPASETHHCPDRTQPITNNSDEDTKFVSLRASWEKTGFRLRLLEGHSDIVTCVIAVDNLVVSGSRDTTVKVWHVPTATEHRNLGGHTGGVTCLSAPPPEFCWRLARSLSLSEKERFVISGSVDCCVRIWALSTGCCVKSIYTFNAVSALCFVPEGEGYIVTGSDGGKVEVCSWSSLEKCQSIKAHEDSVKALQSQGPLVFSGSAEGGVSVWEVYCSDPNPLHLLHHWSSAMTGCAGQNGSNFGQLALSPRGDRLFLANGKASLKILNWRTGSVTRLANHSSVCGVTDCVSQTAGILVGSCFDLASGESSLNLFTLPQCKYLVSLTCQESPRILCFAAWLTASGGHRWVTGGRNLMVWEQLPANCKQRGDVTARRDCQLDACVMESETEGESDDDKDDDNYTSQDASGGADEPGSSWLRCVLQ